MTNTDRFTCALCWASDLAQTPENNAAIRDWAQSREWGPESGHMVAELLRTRRITGAKVRLWWPACPAGTGAGQDTITV